MADKLERIYIVPLRKLYRHVPRTKRLGVSIRALKNFVKRHMKVENVKLSSSINLEIMRRGIKKPPARIKVMCLKDGDTCRVELIGAKPEKKVEPKKEEKKVEPKKEEKKVEPKKEEKKVEPVKRKRVAAKAQA